MDKDDSIYKAIFCFQHCDKTSKIFCFDLPDICPICQENLGTATDLYIPPFRVPAPFTNAKASPYSVVIKPTKGDFLNNYKNSTDLHIAVTNSKGKVFEYDRDGLRSTCHLSGNKQISDKDDWSHCIAIPMMAGWDRKWQQHWDNCLEATKDNDSWTIDKYCEIEHNCYTFVLSVLRAIRPPAADPNALQDKNDFCRLYVVPKTRQAAKYITVYRRLKAQQVIVS